MIQDSGALLSTEKKLGRVKYPDGWVDPDLGWCANSVLEEDVA